MFGGALTLPVGLLGQEPHLLLGGYISVDNHRLPRPQSADAVSPVLNAFIVRAGELF